MAKSKIPYESLSISDKIEVKRKKNIGVQGVQTR